MTSQREAARLARTKAGDGDFMSRKELVATRAQVKAAYKRMFGDKKTGKRRNNFLFGKKAQ